MKRSCASYLSRGCVQLVKNKGMAILFLVHNKASQSAESEKWDEQKRSEKSDYCWCYCWTPKSWLQFSKNPGCIFFLPSDTLFTYIWKKQFSSKRALINQAIDISTLSILLKCFLLTVIKVKWKTFLVSCFIWFWHKNGKTILSNN